MLFYVTCLFHSFVRRVEIIPVFIFVQNDFHFAAYREKEKQMEKIREKIAAKQQKKARYVFSILEQYLTCSVFIVFCSNEVPRGWSPNGQKL